MATTYNPTTAELGDLRRVPRDKITIDPNVRTTVSLDKSFVSSIRVYGFEQYPVGWLDDTGTVHITIGQRRVSAALEIGWPEIPIVVKSKTAAISDRAEELRILTQFTENEQRDNFTEAERAAGYKQLALLGVTEDQIARKTNSPKHRVTTALAVSDTPAAAAALQSHPITLDQAAVFVEFAGDAAAIAELSDTVEEELEQLEHVAQRLRQNRDAQRAADTLATELENAGWDVLRADDSYTAKLPAGAEHLRQLWLPAGDGATASFGMDELAQHPARVAVVYPTPHGYEPAAAMYGVKNAADHGFVRWNGNPIETRAHGGTLTESEKAERRQKREDKATMRAATTVRRQWIRDTLLAPTRKYDLTHQQWIARHLLRAPGTLRPTTGTNTAFILEDLLNLDAHDTLDEHRDPYTGHYYYGYEHHLLTLTTTSTNPTRLALAVAVGDVEQVIGDEKGDAFGRDKRAARYLLQLEQWGYTLSDIEKRMTLTRDEEANK